MDLDRVKMHDRWLFTALRSLVPVCVKWDWSGWPPARRHAAAHQLTRLLDLRSSNGT